MIGSILQEILRAGLMGVCLGAGVWCFIVFGAYQRAFAQAEPPVQVVVDGVTIDTIRWRTLWSGDGQSYHLGQSRVEVRLWLGIPHVFEYKGIKHLGSGAHRLRLASGVLVELKRGDG